MGVGDSTNLSLPLTVALASTLPQRCQINKNLSQNFNAIPEPATAYLRYTVTN